MHFKCSTRGLITYNCGIFSYVLCAYLLDVLVALPIKTFKQLFLLGTIFSTSVIIGAVVLQFLKENCAKRLLHQRRAVLVYSDLVRTIPDCVMKSYLKQCFACGITHAQQTNALDINSGPSYPPTLSHYFS